MKKSTPEEKNSFAIFLPEEREEIWQEARREKSAPSIRELRETLKRVRERQALEHPEDDEIKAEMAAAGEKYRMSPNKIRESLQTISIYCDNFAACDKIEEQIEMRKILLDSVRTFLRDIEETV